MLSSSLTALLSSSSSSSVEYVRSNVSEVELEGGGGSGLGMAGFGGRTLCDDDKSCTCCCGAVRVVDGVEGVECGVV